MAFYDDGESGSANWTAAGSWGLVTLGATEALTVTTFGNAWTDSPNGNYANGIDSALTSASIELTALHAPMLSFLTAYALEAGQDYGYVEASGDGGNTWANVATYTGTNPEWTTEPIGLRTFAGSAAFRLRFRLVTNASVTDDGWFIDNIRITEGPTIYSDFIYLPMVLRPPAAAQDLAEVIFAWPGEDSPAGPAGE